MKRIFPNQVHAAEETLVLILQDKKRASRAVAQRINKEAKWGSRDRKLFYDIIFTLLRGKRKYNALAGIEEDRIAPRIWIKIWCEENQYAWPKQIEVTSSQSLNDSNINDDPAVQWSYPDWLFEKGKSSFKNQWMPLVEALDQPGSVSIRVNRILASPKKVLSDLKEKFGINGMLSPDYPDAILLDRGRKVDKNPLYKKGYFEIQDANSQLIAPFCQAKPDMHVIDLCAGAGGKSLHLSALMRNKGIIKAFDVEPDKLKELKRRAKRARTKNIDVHNLLSDSDLAPFHDWADIVLIDAPCSGLGTLRRNPEIKWNLTQEALDRLGQIQMELLQKAASLLRKGGKLIYATCSILPEENHLQVERFLQTNPNFTLDAHKELLPNTSGFDGFYMARLKKCE